MKRPFGFPLNKEGEEAIPTNKEDEEAIPMNKEGEEALSPPMNKELEHTSTVSDLSKALPNQNSNCSIS